MPYLPTPDLINTRFPNGKSKDVIQQMRIIEEKAKRLYPQIAYHPIQVQSTEVSNPDKLSGESGTTKYDPLYGESVNDSGSGKWEQPHGQSPVDATNAEKFGGPLYIHAIVINEGRDLDLKKYGFDKVRDLVLHIPLVILDEQGITVKEGDEFDWDGHRFMVKQYTRSGYLWGTNIRTYLTANCDHSRAGS